MAKMAELDAEVQQLFNPGCLLPPTPDDYDAAAEFLACLRKHEDAVVHPDEISIL